MTARLVRILVLGVAALFGLAGLSVVPATPAHADAGGCAGSEIVVNGNKQCPYVQIQGSGSTWSKNIVDQWIADVSANGIQVVYTGGGSTKGRQQFARPAAVDFAISEIPYQGKDENGQADTSNGRQYAYLPIVAGGTSFTYQLQVGGQMVRNLRLSGNTIAAIFTNKITNWNDPAITKDNNGRSFPDLPITPVVRADGSGTTAQFTSWLDAVYPSIWRPYFGKSGLTSYYPKKAGTNMISQNGSDQVMNTIASANGNGSIGYVEYSYPLNATAADGKPFPVVKVLNKSGYYVEPTQYATAVGLTKATVRTDLPMSNPLYLTQDLSKVYSNPDPRAYPISSYSYMVIPIGTDDDTMTTSKRQTLADFMYYSLCTGQTKAGAYGYSPLPLNLVQAGFSQLARLRTADKSVQLSDRDVRSCGNPTFDGTNLNKNVLAQKAPMPEACDKVGAGPCGDSVGTTTTDPSSGTGTGTDPGTDPGTDTNTGPDGATTTTGGGAGANGAGGGTQVDPGTGEVVYDPATGIPVSEDPAAAAIYASSVTLAEDRDVDRNAFGWVAVLELLGLVLLPGLLVVALRRRGMTR
ncbi:hypothetical protein BH09ACT11_BH09ACT11_08090 [soil metagenome]